MKQISDSNGIPIRGLFRKDDGSIVVNDPVSLKKNELITNNINKLNSEVSELRTQMNDLMKLIQQKGL